MTQPTGSGLTPAQTAALLALVEAQARIREQLTQTAINAALAPFRAFSLWWDTDAIRNATERIVRVLQPVQRQAAQVTDAYLARALTIMTGRSVRPVGAIDVTRLRTRMPQPVIDDLVAERLIPTWVELGSTIEGPADTIDDDAPALVHDDPRIEYVDPRMPYGRVTDQYRYQVVAEGATESQAKAKALIRLAVAAETDVTLAVRAQHRAGLAKEYVTGWRRVVHPELSKSGVCGLCVVAADRVYKKSELKPIHDRCNCEVLPIIGEQDPGYTLNRDDLERVYAAAGSTGGGKREGGALKKVRVALTEHGELGPVLVDADVNYRGPKQAAQATTLDDAVRLRHQIDQLEISLGQWERKAAAGEDVGAPLTWHINRIAELRRALSAR